MDNLNPNRSTGRYDALALADSIDAVISGGRRMFRNGRNQVKIFCNDWRDANFLLDSPDLKIGGHRLFIH